MSTQQITACTWTFLAQALNNAGDEFGGVPSSYDVENAVFSIRQQRANLQDYECVATGIAALLQSVAKSNQRARDLLAREIEEVGVRETNVYAQQYADIQELQITSAQELTNLLASALFQDYSRAQEQANQEWWDSRPNAGVDLGAVEHEKEASARVILAGEDDEDWRCTCGNDVTDSGFYPVDGDGRFIRDADGRIDGPDYRDETWDRTYKCIVCGQRWRFDPALNRQSGVVNESIGIVIGAL
jgi:hypothetical protein